jgi:serine/threonine-protein kinase
MAITDGFTTDGSPSLLIGQQGRWRNRRSPAIRTLAAAGIRAGDVVVCSPTSRAAVARPGCRRPLPVPAVPELSRDPMRDRLQVTLGASYTLARELGGGGMSRVYVAREEALGRDVVVKVLAPELAEGLSAERFAREIRLAAALQDPHIVPVLAAGVTGEGLPYYTMPFVRGQSLRARLAAGPVPPAEAVAVLRAVAEALEYAHAQGVVHRDVKPENVLLSGRTAVVTDFGIAKALQASRSQAPGGPGAAGGGTLTQLGTSLGTPAYMAPEQAVGDAVDARADLYAWGVVAYELLAGRHPFAGKTSSQQLIAAHLAEAPAPLATAAPGVPAPLAALVMRTLAKDPADRPSSATDVLAALDAAASAPGDAHSGAQPARPPRRRARRWAARALGAAGVLAAALWGCARSASARSAPCSPPAPCGPTTPSSWPTSPRPATAPSAGPSRRA